MTHLIHITRDGFKTVCGQTAGLNCVGDDEGANCEACAAFDEGFDDRSAGKPMREAFTLTPATANAYRNGYVDACHAADDGRGHEGHYE